MTYRNPTIAARYAERERVALELAARPGGVTVQQLIDALDVGDSQLRKTLAALTDAVRLTRVELRRPQLGRGELTWFACPKQAAAAKEADAAARTEPKRQHRAVAGPAALPGDPLITASTKRTIARTPAPRWLTVDLPTAIGAPPMREGALDYRRWMRCPPPPHTT